MAVETPKKSLKDLSLNDAILSEESLTNIVEDHELVATLENYVTTNEFNSKFNDYVKNDDAYQDLTALVNSLELSVQQLNNDKEPIHNAIDTLNSALDNDLSIRIVQSYDSDEAVDGVIYFVKGEDNKLTDIYYNPKTSSEEQSENNDQTNSSSEEQSENNTQPVAASAPTRKRKSTNK